MKKLKNAELGNITGGMDSQGDGSYYFDFDELEILREKEGYNVEMICDDGGNLTYRYAVFKEMNEGTVKEVGEKEIIQVLNKYKKM